MATKAQDATRRDTLRLALSAIHNVEVAERVEVLDDAGVEAALRKQARMRRESIEAYQKAQRADLAAKEEAELAIVESYLPRQLDRAAILAHAREVIAEVGASSPKEQGAVMRVLMPRLKGQADGRLVAEVVSELLAQGT